MHLSQGIKNLITAIEKDCEDTLLPPEGGLEAVG